MRESDIKWESEDSRLWIGPKEKFGYVLYRNGATHSRGFMAFGRLSDAIETGEALSKKSDDYIEKFIW